MLHGQFPPGCQKALPSQYDIYDHVCVDVEAQSRVVNRAIQLACYILYFPLHLVLDICLDSDTETVVAACHCEVTS